MIIAIDNGLKGGIVFLDKGRIVDQYVMPTIVRHGENVIDVRSLLPIFKSCPDATVYLEAFQANQMMTPNTIKSLQASFSAIASTLDLLAMRWKPILPSEWQGQFFPKKEQGVKDPDYTKREALKAAQSLWPDHSFLATERSSKPHDGLVDAALIAEFAAREINEESTPLSAKEEFELNFVKTWNEMTKPTNISKIQNRIPKGRLTQWNQRIKQPIFREGWKEALEYAITDPFYLGEETSWTMDLTYFLRPNSVSKLLEKKKAIQAKTATAQRKTESTKW